MATYNNQHWLLCHIRNSFISTDDTGMCETVMTSDDLPKQYATQRSEQNFLCYPGLDQSDDEDMDAATQSYDIQMFPEIGSHRFRSNTAQKLEKMNKARQKASRIRNIKIDDSLVPHSSDPSAVRIADFFQRKEIVSNNQLTKNGINNENKIKSQLSEELLHCPKLPQNKFMQYARFDGESQTGMLTKQLNIFLSMVNDNQRNYPMKICVIANAKVEEVIGFICYRLTIKYPEMQLQSVRHYGLYITEDNGEMFSEFPPLDLRQPCQKFDFNYLTLAERRPSNNTSRIDYRSFSINSDTENAIDKALEDVQNSSGNLAQDMEKMLDHNSMIEAPMYRNYRLYIIGKSLFKTEVQLGISGERLEIYPVSSNTKFWNRQKAITHNIESIGFCEILVQKSNKAIIRIWYMNPFPHSSSLHFYSSGDQHFFSKGHPFGQLGLTGFGGISGAVGGSGGSQSASSSSSSPQHFNPSISSSSSNSFKYYDFETDPNTAQQILNKMNFILEVRSSATRKEFLTYREKKKERSSKKSTKK